MQTKQLDFWKGEFGENYISRNLPDHKIMASCITLWAKIFNTLKYGVLSSVLEIGSNIGINLRAISLLSPAVLYAVEPFHKALDVCVTNGMVKKENAFCTSVFDLEMFQDSAIDLVFTSGVLIHISHDDLARATDNIVRIAKKFVICIEYFSDKVETLDYRNNKNVLFKRDYGGWYLKRYPNLSLRDYGFVWKEATGLDNLTWWLFEKSP